jgi:hypothetical protein
MKEITMKQKVLILFAVITTFFISHNALAQISESCNSSTACVDVTQGGSGFGVWSATNSGVAVVGFSETAYGVHGISAYSNGVQGESATAGMSGVVGLNSSGSGNGVAGQLSPAGSGSAIYGNNNTTTGWAGNFVGRVWVQTGLDVNGTCVSGNCSSDERLKKNITPLVKSLDVIVGLRPVNFEWINPNNMERSAGVQTGFIAQDVEKVEPSWVATDDDGMKTINMNRLTPIMVDSIKTLNAQNNDLRKLIAMLEALIFGAFVITAAGFAVIWNKFNSKRKSV